MARLTIKNMLDALERAAVYLRQAAQPDDIVSRKDLRLLLADLRGPDQWLVDIFYRQLLELEDSPHARITLSDIDRGLDYLKDELIPLFEVPPEGLSEEEINRMTDHIGPAAVQLAIQLKRAAQIKEVLSAKELVSLIEESKEGLFFDYMGSESGEPIEAFYAEGLSPNLTPQSFAEALQLDPEDPNDAIERFVDATPFFQVFIDQHQDFGLGDKAERIVQLIQTHLRQPAIIVLGRDGDPAVGPQHPVYVVGVAANGDLVGFQSEVIWT